MRILIVLLALFATSAFADCTLIFTTTGTFNGKSKLTQMTKWEDLDQAQVAEIINRGSKIVDAAYFERDKAKKGEMHQLTFKAESSCDGKVNEPMVSVIDGLTWPSVSKVGRLAANVQTDLYKLGDDNVAKGRKTGWGK